MTVVSKSAKMKFIEKYRSEIVVFVVLPISWCIWLWKQFKRYVFAPSPSKHLDRVLRICAEVRDRATSGKLLRTNRSAFDSHSVRNGDKSKSAKVSLHDMRAILGLQGRLLHVEPGVTVGEATKYLLQQTPPLQLECTLEMGEATLGGLALATGMTTHSHVCGLIHDTIEEWEIVLGSGQVVIVTATNQHRELFHALPWSHGTLGFLCSLRLRVIPAKHWVKLTYQPLHSRSAMIDAYKEALASPEPPFFLEMSVVSKDTAVLMKGVLDDGASNAPSNRIGLWFKPWFFKHVESKLDSTACTEELIPTWDYLMRHDRCMCTTMATIIPYGNAVWFRWMLGWLLPPQMSFLKSSHTEETREASIRKQAYQDVAFPADRFDDALALSERLFCIYPLMVYPCLVRDHGGMLRLPNGQKEQMYLNLGIYGVPKSLKENPSGTFRMVTNVRELEEWIRNVNGFQHTYCDSFQSQEEFESMFHHDLYNQMRTKYKAENTFPRVYDKTRPEMDVWTWLAEEKKMV